MTGWAGLFKRTARLKADPAVRWFGKLPSYADYYSSSGDEDWAVEFNEWVLKGFEIYHARCLSQPAPPQAACCNSAAGCSNPSVVTRPAPATSGRRLPISGCILRLPSGMTVLCSVQDYGGDMRGRPFPLCFYAGIPTSTWAGPTSGRLSPAIRAVEQLNRLSREVIRFFKVPGNFEAVFGGRKLDFDGLAEGDDGWRGAARALPVDRWFESMRAVSPADSLQDWLGRVYSWGQRIRSLESESFEPTFWLPLAGDLPIEVQAAGWLHWLGSRMEIEKRALSLIWRQETSPSLIVIARPVVPEDFLLLAPAAGLPHYVDAAGGGEIEGSKTESDAPTPVSWDDFACS